MMCIIRYTLRVRAFQMRSPPRLSKDSHQYTLQDVWYALSHHDVFDHEFWLEVTMQILFTRCVSLFGRALVLLVICLVGALGYVGVYVALPRIAAPKCGHGDWHWRLVSASRHGRVGSE